MRSASALNCDFDILGIAETHLLNDTVLDLDGYRWFGHNRAIKHKRAKTGSGGSGFFVNTKISVMSLMYKLLKSLLKEYYGLNCAISRVVSIFMRVSVIYHRAFDVHAF